MTIGDLIGYSYPEVEIAAINKIMNGDESLMDLPIDIFYSTNYQIIFENAKDIYKEHGTVDYALLVEKMKDRKLQEDYIEVYLLDIMQGGVGIYHNTNALKDELEKAKYIRDFGKSIYSIYGRIMDKDDFSEIVSDIENIGKYKSDKIECYSQKQLANLVINSLQSGIGKYSYKTGIAQIDKISEMVEGNYIIVQAPPKTGKSWILINLLNNLGESSNVVFVTLEMLPEETFLRTASNISSHNMSRLTRTISAIETEIFNRDLNKYLGKKITTIPAYGVKPNQLEKILQSKIGESKIFVIDYLQRMDFSEGDKLREEIVFTSRRLANFAKKNNALVIMAYQCNEPPPNVLCTHRFGKESKAPLEDADIVLSITDTTFFTKDWKTGKEKSVDWDTDKHNSDMVVEIFQRHGSCGFVEFKMDKSTGRIFDNSSKEER